MAKVVGTGATSKKDASPRTAGRPSVKDVLAELEALGKPSTAKTYARHGVKERSVGLPFAALDRLTKRLGVQHALVVPLWDSGIHDARVLAMKLADPVRVTPEELGDWLAQTSNYILTGAIAGLASRRPGAADWALESIGSEHEWTSSAGWSVLTELCLAGALPQEIAGPLLDRIDTQIHEAPNRTRYSMNNALIAIGSKLEAVRTRAFEVADAIGKVEVDHGQTGCKTPSARDYMMKVIAHDAKKAARRSSSQPKRAGSVREEHTINPSRRHTMNTSDEVDAWFNSYDNPHKQTLLEVRRIILSADDRMQECVKWQAPTFTFRGNLASFNPRAKQYASLLFHTGAQLEGNFPSLEGGQGTARYLRIQSVEHAQQLSQELAAIVAAWCALKEGAGATASSGTPKKKAKTAKAASSAPKKRASNALAAKKTAAPTKKKAKAAKAASSAPKKKASKAPAAKKTAAPKKKAKAAKAASAAPAAKKQAAKKAAKRVTSRGLKKTGKAAKNAGRRSKKATTA